MDQIKENIQDCESAYNRCFCTIMENDNITRYRDNDLRDMYMHNFTYIKSDLPNDKLKQIIIEEIGIARKENINFCRLTMDEDFDESNFMDIGQVEKEHYGVYLYKPMISPNWNIKDGCEIKKVTNDSMIEDIIAMDLIHDGFTCGEDFCRRRPKRKGKVYLSDQPLDSYICYLDGVPVGKCDLFFHKDTVKIEDFSVLPDYQHKRIGTTILKHLIDIALLKGAKIVYLVTSEDDTPKEMYMKLGFEKVDENYGLIVNIK